MQVFVSILRGINVSGQKKILMADLKALYEGLKFKDVTTYIQSGNVIFKSDSKLSDAALAEKIEAAILKQYSFTVPVVVRSISQLENIISENQFLKEKNIDLEKLHVTFLSEVPAKSATEAIKLLDYPPDRFSVAGEEVFLYTPGGYGETKLSNKFFENKLKVTATTRNWKTVNKLLEIATSL
jgi:uncharacterized protein (DUF1697 family)